jgi:hypothetical protein
MKREPPLADDEPARSQPRRFVSALLICVATAQILGYTLKTPSMFEANDISRWCTVWSLIERGTYAIGECPWSYRTQDKVLRLNRLPEPTAESSPLKRFEFAIAPPYWKDGEATEQYYSSKPPLLPTLVAGLLYPFRMATGVELDRVRSELRFPRNVPKRVEIEPGRFETRFTLETPEEPFKWPVYVYYFKPILILLNIVPYLITLILFARFLDRHACNDWSWLFALFTAAWGTYLFAFDQTLNNHTVAAWSAFFALYATSRISADGRDELRYFALAGFFSAFAATNEIPAAFFTVCLFVMLFARWPRQTLLAFIPAAAIPILAFLATQFLAFGQFIPVYEEFGTKSYTYDGSYWNTPLEFDYFNIDPEPRPLYLLHMTLGHHGIFSLTPVFILSAWGTLRLMLEPERRLRSLAWLTALLSLAIVAFYAWNPKARNYGGSTQGLRWLFWLIPFWLFMLPRGVEAGQTSRGARIWQLALLAVSVLSVGFALRTPWSHPWILEILERTGLYDLRH